MCHAGIADLDRCVVSYYLLKVKLYMNCVLSGHRESGQIEVNDALHEQVRQSAEQLSPVKWTQ